jgi:hypothetical protein
MMPARTQAFHFTQGFGGDFFLGPPQQKLGLSTVLLQPKHGDGENALFQWRPTCQQSLMAAYETFVVSNGDPYAPLVCPAGLFLPIPGSRMTS